MSHNLKCVSRSPHGWRIVGRRLTGVVESVVVVLNLHEVTRQLDAPSNFTMLESQFGVGHDEMSGWLYKVIGVRGARERGIIPIPYVWASNQFHQAAVLVRCQCGDPSKG
jgi:hypothetical protein